MKVATIIFVLLFGVQFCFCQENEPQWGQIQDNSFLLEEAYNQEPGIVQHINTFQWFRKSGWTYTFTQEWPATGLKHQLSYTIPISGFDFERGKVTGLSDIALNYRYQLVGNGDAQLAIAPRFSVLLPTGDELKNLGLGGTGFQFNFPLSLILSPKLMAHSNAGFIYAPHAKDDLENEASIVNFQVGQSFVWLVSMRFNILLETTYASVQSVTGKNQTDRLSSGFISPGIRWAYNFSNGLQIVPGIAFPIGIGPETDRSVFLYLSFEHTMWKPHPIEPFFIACVLISMKKMTTAKRLIFFFALAFPLSWYPWIIALIKGTTSGPNPLGPLVAALIVTALTEGKIGIKDFLKRLVQWRVDIRWYAVAFLLPVFCCLVAAGIALATGAQLKPAAEYSNLWGELAPKFVFILLFIGLGEEPGWRGYAIEKFQKLYSPLKSSLILAPIWALWHLPLMGSEFATPIVPAFLLSVLGATIVLTLIYNGSQRSILLPMLMHATVNTVASGFMFQVFRAQDMKSLWYIYAVIWFATSMAAAYRLRNKKIFTAEYAEIAEYKKY